MQHRNVLARTLRWTAIITGTFVLVFLVIMLIGHLTGDANGPSGMTFGSKADLAGFILFPLCTMAGLILAYKWELIGGAVVLVSIAGLFVLRPDLLPTAFWLWGLPALFYLAHWYLSRANAHRMINQGS
jgi:hypothetical protein